MAKLDSTGLSSFEWKEDCERYLPGDCRTPSTRSADTITGGPGPTSGPLRGTLRAAGAASAELESIPNPNLKRLGSRSVDIGRQERISRSEDDAGRKVH